MTISEDIKILEKNIEGMKFMVGASDDMMMQIDYMLQITEMEESLRKLKTEGSDL